MSQIIAATYEIIEKLGSGGGGNVYLANHLRLNKKIVLKADKRKLSTPPELLRREVDVLKNLKHPHIPQVYDFFVENGIVYTVMDYVQGESLDRALKREQKFSQAQVIQWAIQLLDALVYLHKPIHGDPPKGFIHSDIKPANIMLLPDGTVCLIDFNIALALGEDNIIGCSPGYASPEHYGLDYSDSLSHTETIKTQSMPTVMMSADDATVVIHEQTDKSSSTTPIHIIRPDVRSDIYSMGATLYHLLSGVRPARDAVQVQELSPEQFSPLVVKIISKAMEPNPNLRYQTAEEMLRDFQNLRKRDLRVLGLRRRRIIGCAVSAILFTAGFLTTFTALKRLETTESWLKLAEYSAGALQEGNMEQAIQYSLEAFPPQNSPLVPQYVPEAQRSLTNALGVYDLSDSFKSHGTVQLPSAPLYVSLSPHGTTAACVYSGAVAVVDTAACRITQTFPAAPSALTEAEYLDDDRIVYGGADGICAADIVSQKILWVGEPATGIAVSGDGQRIAGVYRDQQKARIYDAQTGEMIREVDFQGRQQQVVTNDLFANPNDNLLALDQTGSLLAVSFSDGSLRLFSLSDENDSVEILKPGSGYTHFEGGFYEQYFAFSASGSRDSIFAVVDTTKMEQTGGYQSPYPFSTRTDSTGIYLQTQNLLVRIHPETGEQVPLVTTPKEIYAYAFDQNHAVIGTKDGFEFFGTGAVELTAFEIAQQVDFAAVKNGTALIANRNAPSVRLLKYENHPQEQIVSYDPAYAHDEARVSYDKEKVILFSYDRFRICHKDGTAVNDTLLPHPEQVYDQQFRREEGRCWLEVYYYDGTVDCYDGDTGQLIGRERREKPNPDLTEEFFTQHLRIESPLHGQPVAYDIHTGKQVAVLEEDAYLTYVTQTDLGIVVQYITTEGDYYGQLLDENCQVLAELPYLCDVMEQQLIFDYPTGNVRISRIYSIDELLSLASLEIDRIASPV